MVPSRAVPAAILLALLLLPAHARSEADGLAELMVEAAQSSCFQAPARPPAGAPPAALLGAAEAGDAAAMQRVGDVLLADPARARQALDWLERAALAGAVSAAADAGRLHMAGLGTASDPDAAAAWWRFGAAHGDARAMACLSAAHLLGRGVAQDPAQAARWAMLRETAAAGRVVLRPSAADFDRRLPVLLLAEARRLARQAPEPAAPPEPLAALGTARARLRTAEAR